VRRNGRRKSGAGEIREMTPEPSGKSRAGLV